jgi:hypothetical protein
MSVKNQDFICNTILNFNTGQQIHIMTSVLLSICKLEVGSPKCCFVLHHKGQIIYLVFEILGQIFEKKKKKNILFKKTFNCLLKNV